MQLACLVRAELQEHTPKSPSIPTNSMLDWRRRLAWGQVRASGIEREGGGGRQWRRQDFHGGVSEEACVKRACKKNSKPCPFLPYLPVTAHYSDDLLACLQRKQSKNNQNSAVLWFMNKEKDRVRPHLFVFIAYLHIIINIGFA